ncbi:hypothetical protein NFI96_015944 [Prochilodus magdalenae]|nr:hypothetical protein NFI96_015944 [Prochilodus magdalenae]
MEVNSVNSSLTITAVQDSDSGLYYCSNLDDKFMTFSTPTHLQIRERKQVPSEDPEKAKEVLSTRKNDFIVCVEAGSPPEVFTMLTLLFGAMVAVLLSALLILIFIRQSERKERREQQRGGEVPHVQLTEVDKALHLLYTNTLLTAH